MSLGFVGAWSMPIRRASGAVLGTFGTYFREERQPTEREMNGIRCLAAAAAQLIGPPGVAAAAV